MYGRIGLSDIIGQACTPKTSQLTNHTMALSRIDRSRAEFKRHLIHYEK